MSWLRLPPRALNDGKEADSGRGRMVLWPARAPSVGARRSCPLVVLPQPRVAPSAVGALVAPRRSQALGSRAATWLQRRGSGTPAGIVADCTGTSCVGRPSRGPVSMPSSWCRLASSSSSWRLASASSLSRARSRASASRWRGASSGSELLDEEATQTWHSRVGSCHHVVRALQVVVDPGAAPVARRLLT
jgi:hypothetical protein